VTSSHHISIPNFGPRSQTSGLDPKLQHRIPTVCASVSVCSLFPFVLAMSLHIFVKQVGVPRYECDVCADDLIDRLCADLNLPSGARFYQDTTFCAQGRTFEDCGVKDGATLNALNLHVQATNPHSAVDQRLISARLGAAKKKVVALRQKVLADTNVKLLETARAEEIAAQEVAPVILTQDLLGARQAQALTSASVSSSTVMPTVEATATRHTATLESVALARWDGEPYPQRQVVGHVAAESKAVGQEILELLDGKREAGGNEAREILELQIAEAVLKKRMREIRDRQVAHKEMIKNDRLAKKFKKIVDAELHARADLMPSQ
jgi:hypothetical protein